MKKLLLSVIGCAAIMYLPAASAVVVTLHSEYESGAVFNGNLTFSDSYNALLDVDGLLTGGSYGSQNIHWAWWIGTGQDFTDRDYDGNAATYEDWLMGGVEGVNNLPYIGISWYFPVAGALTLNLNTDIYHSGINQVDRAVRYTTVPEPETLLLFSVGILGLGLATRRRRTN